MTLTIAVLSKDNNPEKSFLNKLNFADEILIISDSPFEGSKVTGKRSGFYHPLAGDFAEQRNFALSKAMGDWIFFVDTDEVVSSQLAKEITSVINSSNKVGYYVNRIDTLFCQVILHGETGNTKILRLAKRNAGKFTRNVHEYWRVKGEIGELQNPLFHTKDNFISQFLDRIALYGPIDAINLNTEGKTFNFFRLLAYPKAKFLLNYFFKKGFLDGYPGLFQAYLMSIQSLSVRVFQWTLQKRSTV